MYLFEYPLTWVKGVGSTMTLICNAGQRCGWNSTVNRTGNFEGPCYTRQADINGSGMGLATKRRSGRFVSTASSRMGGVQSLAAQ